MRKLGRNYSLSVQGPLGKIITITPPFTIEFDVTRKILSSVNIASIRIYNLAPVNRNQMRFNYSNPGEYRAVKLKAGYQNQLSIVFQGNMTQAWSAREGTNMVTQIECFDGGFAFDQGNAPRNFAAGTPTASMISGLFTDLQHVTPGYVGQSFQGSDPRGRAFTGSTADNLRELAPGCFFVDNETANALGPNETLPGVPLLINAASGLLGTPLLQQSILTFDMVFEPMLQAGQQIQLESSTEKSWSGIYKANGIKHRGMISDAVCGEVITSVEVLWLGPIGGLV